MNKREMIERALQPYFRASKDYVLLGSWLDCSTLADQAIVIKCKVQQTPYDSEGEKQFWETAIWPQDMDADGYIQYPDKRGTPGEAIAIILPLKEKDK